MSEREATEGRPVKRVTVFVGSARQGNTHRAVQQLLTDLQELGPVEHEVVALKDYRIGTCRGCLACFTRGEERCPLKDDRDVLIRKIEASDGVVFATPNYSFQVSALMKLFLDRLGFVLHRPRFFGKTFTSIVVQGVYGGSKIVQYLDFVAGGLGFNTVKGSCLTAFQPMSAVEKQKIDKTLASHAARFHAGLMKPAYPTPSLARLAMFRMGRTCSRLAADDTNRDHIHYRDNGWFESDYYYPVRLGVLKKLVGRLVDWIGARMVRNRLRALTSSPAQDQAAA